MPVLLFIYAQRKKDGIRELCATKQCQRAMRLFYHNLPCLVSHGNLNSGKTLYVAEFIPDFSLFIGDDRYYRNNQLAVSFIDSVKHFATTHWRNFSQRCYLRQAAAILESRFPDTRHAVRQCKLGQATATSESTISYARHTVRQCQFGQASATHESSISDARHAVRQYKFDQAAATTESIIPDARHAVR